MAPELSEIYLTQLRRKEEKYGVDWDMSGQEQDRFEHFAKKDQFFFGVDDSLPEVFYCSLEKIDHSTSYLKSNKSCRHLTLFLVVSD